MMHTVFLRSDTAATIFIAARFVWLLFKGGYYLRVTTIRGRLLSEGGYYPRVATIRGWRSFLAYLQDTGSKQRSARDEAKDTCLATCS